MNCLRLKSACGTKPMLFRAASNSPASIKSLLKDQ
jgi:hypothetical protein